MTIGCDIDGTVTVSSVRINFKLPWWIFIFLFFVPSAKKMIKILISLSANHKIILISARPKELDFLTKWWLNRKHVPYSLLFLVGLERGIEERKLEIIQQEKIDMFIDDDEKIITFLKERGIDALSPKGACS